MSRYWNGHQWKDLPAEDVQAAPGAVVATAEPDGADPQPVTEPAAPVAAVVGQLAAPTRASLVPTHAEYGDVFVAVSAAAGEPAR